MRWLTRNPKRLQNGMKTNIKIDMQKLLTTSQAARGWWMHVLSVSRSIRRSELASVMFEKRLVPLAAVDRIDIEVAENATISGITNYYV